MSRRSPRRSSGCWSSETGGPRRRPSRSVAISRRRPPPLRARVRTTTAGSAPRAEGASVCAVEAWTHPRATTHEREQVVPDFVRLCQIESPSRRERAMADAVTGDLRGLGLEVEEDASRAETGSDAGNLLARIPGRPGARTILLCAHLDTVPLDAPVQVERTEEGLLRNRNKAIVGADNKAAVAVILAVARRLLADGSPPAGVEILFTTCEELALAGAKAFDVGKLASDFGFVYDHASPIGELIVAAPT